MPEGVDLGSAFGAIVIDASGVRKGIQEAQAAFRAGMAGMEQETRKFHEKLTDLGKNLTILTAPLTAFGVTGIKVAADFDSLMKQIELFGGVTGKQLDQVRGYITKLGADTVFSSQQAGEALLNLLKTGMSLQDSMAAMPKIIDLATVGNLGLARSSEIVTGVLSSYKLSAKDASRITNALARGANASSAEVGDLGDALNNVAPIAKQYGLNVEQTTAILSMFANNNIKGAEAGTQLKSMLLQLYNPVEANQKALKQLGIRLYDNKGNIRDLNVVIKEMDAALNKLPVSRQNELMQELGGSYGILGLSVLRANRGFEGMLANMNQAPGAAEVAAKAQDTFAFSLDSLGGSIETLQTNFLTPFMNNVLKPMVNDLIRVINAVSEWAKNNPELATTIATVAAGVAALGAALLVAGPILGAIGGAIALLTGPIGLVIAAVGLLAAAWTTNFGGIRDFIQGQVLPALQRLADWFTVTALPAVMAFVQTQVIPFVQAFIKELVRIWEAVSPGLTDLYNWFMTTGLPAVVGFIQTVVAPIIQGWIDTLAYAWQAISPALTDLYNWFITTGLPQISNIIKNFVDVFLFPFISLLAGIWTAVQPALKSLEEGARPIFKTIGTFIQGVVDLIKEFVGAIDRGMQAWANFKNAVTVDRESLPGGKTMLESILPGFKNPFVRDSGGRGEKGQSYLIGKGAMPEAFIADTPGTDGTYIPNFDKVLASMAGKGGAGIQIGTVAIYANSRAEGRAAADGFAQRLEEIKQRRGS